MREWILILTIATSAGVDAGDHQAIVQQQRFGYFAEFIDCQQTGIDAISQLNRAYAKKAVAVRAIARCIDEPARSSAIAMQAFRCCGPQASMGYTLNRDGHDKRVPSIPSRETSK